MLMFICCLRQNKTGEQASGIELLSSGVLLVRVARSETTLFVVMKTSVFVAEMSAADCEM